MSAEVIADKPATMRMRTGRAPVVWPWLLVAIAWLLALTATLTMPGHWELVVRVRPAQSEPPIQAVFLLTVT